VPVPAVQRGEPGTFVYVINANNTVSVRPIKVGPTDGGYEAVLSGLNPGERVVTDGTDRLRDGAAVTLPAAQKPGGQAEGGQAAGGHAPGGQAAGGQAAGGQAAGGQAAGGQAAGGQAAGGGATGAQPTGAQPPASGSEAATPDQPDGTKPQHERHRKPQAQ
jgi:multidrug efflux system membrane fusion protein